jgi:hypothetical protein
MRVYEDEAAIYWPPLRNKNGGSAFFFPFPIMYRNHRFRFSYQLLPLRHRCHPVSCTLNPGLRARETIPTTPLYYLPRSRQVNLTATVPQRPNASMHIHKCLTISEDRPYDPYTTSHPLLNPHMGIKYMRFVRSISLYNIVPLILVVGKRVRTHPVGGLCCAGIRERLWARKYESRDLLDTGAGFAPGHVQSVFGLLRRICRIQISGQQATSVEGFPANCVQAVHLYIYSMFDHVIVGIHTISLLVHKNWFLGIVLSRARLLVILLGLHSW